MCDATIRPFGHKDVELVCEKEGSDHEEHLSVLKDYAYPGSKTKLAWSETDRRNYHGTWPGRCYGFAGCILPLGHRGGHSI